MIRHELTSSILRFYPLECLDPFEPYVGICTLLWESPSTVWIKGMHGTISRAHLRELMVFCTDLQIETLKAHRANGHLLPFMRLAPDGHMELSVSQVVAKLAAKTL